MGARRRLTAAGGSLQLRSPHPRVRFLLRLTGLEEAFTVLT